MSYLLISLIMGVLGFLKNALGIISGDVERFLRYMYSNNF